jgi:hypothetical protein
MSVNNALYSKPWKFTYIPVHLQLARHGPVLLRLSRMAQPRHKPVKPPTPAAQAAADAKPAEVTLEPIETPPATYPPQALAQQNPGQSRPPNSCVSAIRRRRICRRPQGSAAPRRRRARRHREMEVQARPQGWKSRSSNLLGQLSTSSSAMPTVKLRKKRPKPSAPPQSFPRASPALKRCRQKHLSAPRSGLLPAKRHGDEAPGHGRARSPHR